MTINSALNTHTDTPSHTHTHTYAHRQKIEIFRKNLCFHTTDDYEFKNCHFVHVLDTSTN